MTDERLALVDRLAIRRSLRELVDAIKAERAEVERLTLDRCEITALRDALIDEQDERDAWRARAQAAEAENAEYKQFLEEHPRHLMNEWRAVKAGLAAVEGLLPRWKEGDFDLPPYTKGVMDGRHKCAAELSAALQAHNPGEQRTP